MYLAIPMQVVILYTKNKFNKKLDECNDVNSNDVIFAVHSNDVNGCWCFQLIERGCIGNKWIKIQNLWWRLYFGYLIVNRFRKFRRT